jgi:hypothetical protein
VLAFVGSSLVLVPIIAQLLGLFLFGWGANYFIIRYH